MPPTKRKRPNNDSQEVAPAPATTRRATRRTPNPAPPADPPAKDPALSKTTLAQPSGPKTRRGRQAAQPAEARAMATRKQAKGAGVPNGAGATKPRGALSGSKYTQTTLKWGGGPDGSSNKRQSGGNEEISNGASAPEMSTDIMDQPPQASKGNGSASSRRGAAARPSQIADAKAPPQTGPTTETKQPPTADRNIDKVVLGDICFKTWYPSYYGKDVLGDTTRAANGAAAGATGKTSKKGERDAEPTLSRLYVCPCCFKYSKEIVLWWEHVRVCESKNAVPGRKIYVHPKVKPAAPAPDANGKGTKRRRGEAGGSAAAPSVEDQGEWSIWEVDGAKDGLFCQNLSLFAKLFLDNKSVFFDVTGFNYFLLVFSRRDPSSPASSPPKHQICGFFSKEKLSWDNNNLACILVFPPWQRKGLGSLLMGVSYEISRMEGIMGGPEKPISELGRKGYGRFWGAEIARWILSAGEAVVNVDECSEATWIAPEDCLAVLRDMDVVEEDGLGPKKTAAARPEAEEEDKDEDAEREPPKEELVPRVRISKDAVKAWVARQRIGLERACDPEGFATWYVEELERKVAAAKASGTD